MKKIMKFKIIFLFIILTISSDTLFSFIINVPSLSYQVIEAQDIFDGTFKMNDNKVYFQIDNTLKGNYRGPTIQVTNSSDFPFFKFKNFIKQKKLNQKNIILGKIIDNKIFLTWLHSSIWPFYYDNYTSSDECLDLITLQDHKTFISNVLDFENISADDLSAIEIDKKEILLDYIISKAHDYKISKRNYSMTLWLIGSKLLEDDNISRNVFRKIINILLPFSVVIPEIKDKLNNKFIDNQIEK